MIRQLETSNIQLSVELKFETSTQIIAIFYKCQITLIALNPLLSNSSRPRQFTDCLKSIKQSIHSPNWHVFLTKSRL